MIFSYYIGLSDDRNNLVKYLIHVRVQKKLRKKIFLNFYVPKSNLRACARAHIRDITKLFLSSLRPI